MRQGCEPAPTASRGPARQTGDTWSTLVQHHTGIRDKHNQRGSLSFRTERARRIFERDRAASHLRLSHGLHESAFSLQTSQGLEIRPDLRSAIAQSESACEAPHEKTVSEASSLEDNKCPSPNSRPHRMWQLQLLDDLVLPEFEKRARHRGLRGQEYQSCGIHEQRLWNSHLL